MRKIASALASRVARRHRVKKFALADNEEDQDLSSLERCMECTEKRKTQHGFLGTFGMVQNSQEDTP